MARILTIEEANEADIFWYEKKSKIEYGNEFGRFSSWKRDSIAITLLGFSGWQYEDARYYGSWWRCWDMKPTNAERKAAKWEEENDTM